MSQPLDKSPDSTAASVPASTRLPDKTQKVGASPAEHGNGTAIHSPTDPQKGVSESEPKQDGSKTSPATAPGATKDVVTAAPSPSPVTVLQARPFILKTHKQDAADATPRVTGSILSQSLDKMLAAGGRVAAEGLTMAALRKLVPEMSRYPSIHKFCTPFGTLVDDENISIIDYLAIETPADPVAPASGTPSLNLYFRPTKLGETAGRGANGTDAATVAAPDLAQGPFLSAPEGPGATLLPKAEAPKQLINDAAFGGVQMGSSTGAGKLSEAQWAVVLRDCAIFYGWINDPRTKNVTRAPKPPFRLRSRVNQEPVAQIPDFTIVARYLFPRCDLLLWPDELEPTPKLAVLLETIHRTKSIKALRRLQAEYGSLFCQRVTLGGRLLSTKTVRSNSSISTEEHKESFKVAVGASVSGSYVGFSASASVKHDTSSGQASNNAVQTSSQHETCVFEAVGGETILTAEPKAWSPTVANHELWRIINRDGLAPLVEILSCMPRYEAVQSWFVQAVPALSQYMILNEAHECRVRLRITSPGNSLSVSNSDGNASFYLGHNDTVTPSLSTVKTTPGCFWVRATTETPIFEPSTYRAPAILGYRDYKVGDAKFGSASNAEFTQTAWDIIAPFDEELLNGTRVILRSCPLRNLPKEQAERKNGAEPPPPPNPSHMVVYRNAQGEFLPAMSDSDEYQYWRILISNDTSAGPRHIKPGDQVRLCWDFRDQTTGWRDFTQDVFGRRQPCTPADVSGPLFLKVPWPRFENEGTPTALIMSPDAGDLTTKAVIVVAGGKTTAIRYAMQDVQLRIDPVYNNGFGDSCDYMLNSVHQKEPTMMLEMRLNGYPLQLRQDMFWFGVR